MQWEEIKDENRLGLIPSDKKRGVTVLGPIVRPDGTKVIIVYKVEYDYEVYLRLISGFHEE